MIKVTMWLSPSHGSPRTEGPVAISERSHDCETRLDYSSRTYAPSTLAYICSMYILLPRGSGDLRTMSCRIVMSENYFKKVNAHSLNKEARDMRNSTDKGRKRSSGKKRNQRHKGFDRKLEAVCMGRSLPALTRGNSPNCQNLSVGK